MARLRTAVACVAAGLLGAGIVAAVMAAPAPVAAGKAVERWEYAEIQIQGMRQQGARMVRQDTPHWVTAEEDIEADNWADLATRLKAPAAKKAATEESHKLRVFNRPFAIDFTRMG